MGWDWQHDAVHGLAGPGGGATPHPRERVVLRAISTWVCRAARGALPGRYCKMADATGVLVHVALGAPSAGQHHGRTPAAVGAVRTPVAVAPHAGS